MKKKVLLAALLFVVLAIPAAWLQLTSGVMVNEQFYARKNADMYISGRDHVAITRAADGADFAISLNGESLSVQLRIEGDRYSFRYEDGRTVEGRAGAWTDQLVTEDGMPLAWEDGISVTVGDEEPESILTREYTLSNVLYRMYAGICEQRGHILVILMALFIYAMGAASFFWPDEVHFFGSRWRYSHAELSDDGRLVQRISGVACGIVGVVLLYAPLFW